jgi:hypothetical protein
LSPSTINLSDSFSYSLSLASPFRLTLTFFHRTRTSSPSLRSACLLLLTETTRALTPSLLRASPPLWPSTDTHSNPITPPLHHSTTPLTPPTHPTYVPSHPSSIASLDPRLKTCRFPLAAQPNLPYNMFAALAPIALLALSVFTQAAPIPHGRRASNAPAHWATQYLENCQSSLSLSRRQVSDARLSLAKVNPLTLSLLVSLVLYCISRRRLPRAIRPDRLQRPARIQVLRHGQAFLPSFLFSLPLLPFQHD